jgi:MoaA/NifB/PqqE/SkfB family radical SAM enzyme
MEWELLRAAVEDAARLGFGAVSVSGGEPLLYRPLTALLAAAKSAGLRTSVTTNGMALTARRLGELSGLLDTLAISLDGRPATHSAMRQNTQAFAVLDARMPGVRAAGIPFGFISTLTMTNVAELEFVVGYARDHGAAFVQVHPLEPEGAAARNLDGHVPDSRELAFALIESRRLAAAYGLPVQVDISRRADLAVWEAELRGQPDEGADTVAQWLSPVVVETDGTVVPLTYGFPREYALGSLYDASLPTLAERWDPAGFRTLCRDTVGRLRTENRAFFNWYEELGATYRRHRPVAGASR